MIHLAQGIPSSPLYFIIVWAILGAFFVAPVLAIGFGIAGSFFQPRFKRPAWICVWVWLVSAGLVLLLSVAD